VTVGTTNDDDGCSGCGTDHRWWSTYTLRAKDASGQCRQEAPPLVECLPRCCCTCCVVFFFSGSLEPSNVVINAHIGQHVVLPCMTMPSVDGEVVWRFQRYCFSFEHQRPYICADRTVLLYGNEHTLHKMTSNDTSLDIKSISEKMNGMYTCEERRRVERPGNHLLARVQLNVFCE